MVLKSITIISIASITSAIISTLSIIIRKVSIIMHGPAPLNKQELLGMPATY